MDANIEPSQPAKQGVSPLVGVKAEPDQDTKPPLPLAGTPQQSAERAVELVPETAVKETLLASRWHGDIVIVLNNKTRVRVHSAVLVLASIEFQKMLVRPRSAEEPQVIELLQDEPEAMMMMLRTMHMFDIFDWKGWNFETAGLKFAKMGAVAVKYKCASKVAPMAEAVMLRGINILSMTTLGTAMTMRLYAQYAAAAHLLWSNSLFSHYTRRLVLDATTSFTQIQEIEGCSGLPTSVILGLEEQRSALREELIATISARTNGKCQTVGCSQYSTSGTFTGHITRRLSVPHWPPPWASTTLRSLLEKLKKTGDVQLGHTYPLCQHKNNPVVISQKALKTICDAVDGRARGLCLTCARDDKSQSRCEHVEGIIKSQLKDWIV
ncbi:hypothetical protein LTR56_018910 [Elasticomyces elasticus]|nr:hypothetical protein LTR56_018910 [Elasticomyces elasticus]KAK3649849.1 hypothetical protein LTR22_012725 [Elasticomyces elasticus]KAK4918200.1 hypothetical protein LTR49_014056 [Elasticomyces elasticus]KAK5757746.1 hypothetical protein LTS12_012205 [Elasticomyces elasticus]